MESRVVGLSWTADIECLRSWFAWTVVTIIVMCVTFSTNQQLVYIVSGVLSAFFLFLDLIFETKLHMSLLCASSRETQSHRAVVTYWVTKICFYLFGHSRPATGVYVPQGFITTSHNWHVLGHNWNYPLAFSAVHCDLTSYSWLPCSRL
jgi:hypothetical protein